jgi:trehalose-6-phosphatase
MTSEWARKLVEQRKDSESKKSILTRRKDMVKNGALSAWKELKGDFRAAIEEFNQAMGKQIIFYASDDLTDPNSFKLVVDANSCTFTFSQPQFTFTPSGRLPYHLEVTDHGTQDVLGWRSMNGQFLTSRQVAEMEIGRVATS